MNVVTRTYVLGSRYRLDIRQIRKVYVCTVKNNFVRFVASEYYTLGLVPPLANRQLGNCTNASVPAKLMTNSHPNYCGPHPPQRREKATHLLAIWIKKSTSAAWFSRRRSNAILDASNYLVLIS